MGQAESTEQFEHLWRRVRWLLLALAIGLQSLHQWCFGCLNYGFFNPDKAYQVTAARSLLDGHGLTRPEANPRDAATPLRRPVFQWPLGYSLLMAGVWSGVGDLWTSSVLVEILAVVLFFTAWLVIFERLPGWVDGRVKLLVLGYWALVWNPLVAQTGPEMLAQALFCWAVALGLAVVAGRFPLAAAAGSAICLAGAAAFRFAYWPLLAVVPGALAVGWIFTRCKRQLALATAVNAAVAGMLFVAVAWLQNGLTGRTTFLSDPARNLGGPWPSNLLWICPFPAASLGFDYVWPWLARQVSWLQFVPEVWLEWSVSAFVLAGVLAPLGLLALRLRRSGRESSGPEGTAAAVFASAGVLTAGLTLAMLVHLSLITPLENSWTYVVERRYYAVFFAFCSLALAWSVLGLARLEGGVLRQGVKWASLGLVITWCLAGAVWRTSRFVRHYADARGHLTARLESMSECRAIHAAVREQVAAGRAALFVHPDLSPVYSFGERREHFLAMMAGAAPVDFQTLPALELPPGKTAAVLAVLPEPRTGAGLAAEQCLRRRARLEPLVRLRDGWLYRSVWGAAAPGADRETTSTVSRSSESCPTR